MVFYVSKDDGTVTAITASSGVPTESDATNAKGDYKIALSQSETNADKLRFSGKSVTANVVVVPQTIYTVPPLFTSLSVDANGRVDVIKVAGTTQTARDLGAGVIATTVSDKTGYALSSTQTFNNTGTWTGNVSGSVGSVTARVTANTEQLAGQTVTAAAGVTFPTSVASPTNITAGTITTVTNLTNAATAGDFTATMKTSITTAATSSTPAVTVSDKTGFSLAAAGLDAVVIETGVNARQALSVIAAATAGKASGLDTSTAVFYAIGTAGTSTTRITATTSSGNRTATTLSLPA
jgi:hypothetical protein